MAEYEISHPRIPQIGSVVLEGPDDLPPPTERDFWEVVQQQVRPLGLSQLTDEEKISAYKNGYFGEPKPVEGQPEQPGIIDGLLDLGGKAVLRGLQISKTLTGGTLSPDLGIGISGPYDKLLRLPDKAVPYEKTENVDQFREAGKYLFGFLDNTEDKLDFDPITEALKRTGMPFYSKNKDARGRVKTAAMDYAQDSMIAGVGEGYARAASGGEFLYKGGKFLKDKLLLDEADEADVLDYVNSSIELDGINHRYENSAELAAFVLENPQESLKAMGAGLVGGLTPIVEAEDLNEILIDEEDINLDSDLQQDIRSGLVQPDTGLSFLTEVVGDPMNMAGGTLAKGVTAPQRIALSGRISKTLKEVNILNKAKASTIKYLDKLPEQSAMHQRVGSRLVELNAELLEKQKIVDKYARNSLFLRMAAQSSPDELLKVAAKNLDTATDAGKLSMNMVYNAMKPNGKIGLVRKGIAMGARLTPEIAGATIGASLAGAEGAVAGALAPAVLKGAKILSTMPENVAISYIMRSATEAGEEITEQAARKQYRQFTNKVLYPTGILGLGGGAILSSQEGGSGISDSLLKIGGGAFALKFLPKLAQFSDAAIRDSRVIGPELIYARGENSPFFNRLALLPSADEGLIGANADRFQALTRTSSGETILEKTIDKIRPIGRGIATSVTDEFPTGAPFRPGLSDTNKMLSNPTRKVAQFLDRTPTLGRGIEALGRFGTVVTAGSTLPATFGYVGSGGQAEGALAGALVSAPFTSIGAGVGMYQTFKNKGDLFQQKMGDVHYYREHLNKSEQADFDALPMHIRMALAGYSLSHPDVIFQPGTEGQGNFSFNPDLQTSVIEYRKDTGAGLIEGVLAHEIGHKIEIHGLTPMVNKIFFGDPVTKEGGVYGKYNDEGKIEPNQEFLDLRDIYLQKLSADKSINPANADRYQGPEGNQIFASELFADQVKDYLLSGKKDKGNTVAQKIIRASSEAMLGTPFIRDFLLKMNFPMKADGKFIEGGFFEGKQRRIPEITKLIDQYYKDTRAMRQREIQGDEVITPGTNRVDKELSIDSRKAKRPIDQGDFENSFSIKDQNDPAIKAKLDTGGVFKWRPTADGGSELETGPTGTPKRYTAKELEKQNRAQGDHAIKVFEKNGVDIITHKDGKKSTGDITNLTPEMIDELAQGPWHPRQIQTLREISRSLREGDGERAGFLIGYFAASTGRKPKAVPFALRQEMPYGFKLTKDGNILALLHDVPQLEKNLKFLKGGKRLPGKYRDEYNQLFDNDTEVWEAFRQYRVNTANGMDGQLGLDDDPSRAIRKKNFLNALHGAIDTEHINLNPILSEISKLKGMDMFNPSKRQPFGPATKTFRLDRIFDVTRSGNRNSNVNVDRAKKLLMPTEIQEGSPGSFFRPKSSRDKSAKLRTFKSPVYLKDGSRLSGVADNPEQNPFYGFDKNGQEFSQRREYVNPQDITKSRDSDRTANQIRNELESGQKLFMPASEAGAGKGKVAEAAKLWQEKGTDSPYFKKWFGKSKVVDENGEPLVVYRGDRPGKEVFTGRENPYNLIQGNVFFSDNTEVAKFYTDQRTNYLISPEQMNEADGLYGTYLRLKKPLEVDAKENSWTDIPDPFDEGSIQIDDLGEIAQKKGYDGMIIKNVYDQGGFGTQYIAFSPEQIKSATGNRGTFDAGERNILFMPASEAKNLKSGDMLTLDDKSLKLFLPSPGNPNASLSDFKGKNVQVLTADLSVVGDKKADGVMISFTGGPGYLSVNDAWGFTNEAGAKAFKTRWERDGKPLIGITSMKQENHRASTLTREYYVRKFMEAINDGKISENTVNRHIKTALKRAIDGKNGLTNNQKAALKTVKTIEDFLKVFPDKELIPWKATPMIYGKLDAKTLPIKQDRLKKLGLDTETILRETRQPEYNDIKKGSLLAIAEYDGSGATYRPDLNSAYPWSIPLNEKAFLKDFADIQDLSSRPDLRGSDGEANMAVAMGAGVMLDKLGRGDVNFMPSDPKAPTRQPANRITRQAPAMPGNRFMAPAVSAGAKSAERFR